MGDEGKMGPGEEEKEETHRDKIWKDEKLKQLLIYLVSYLENICR